MTKPNIMKFKFITRKPSQFFMEVPNHINETEWMGKEPGTCKVLNWHQKEPISMGDYAEFELNVVYRPKGCLFFSGNGWVWDSWTPNHIDATQDGQPLDGKGKPLPAGERPVFLDFTAFRSVDFNKYDFGKLISEEECDDAVGMVIPKETNEE